MAKRTKMTLSIGGEGVSPRTLDVRLLAADLGAIDRMARAAAHLPESAAAVTLESITEGSVVVGLLLHAEARAEASATLERMRDGRFDEMPIVERRALAEIAKRHAEQGQTVTLAVGKRRVEFASKHKLLAEAPRARLQGSTTIYGRILQVTLRQRGAEAAARIFLTDQQKPLEIVCSHSVARELGGRLGDEVGLDGDAEWDPVTLELCAFKATHVNAFGGLVDDAATTLAALGPVATDLESIYDDSDERAEAWGEA